MADDLTAAMKRFELRRACETARALMTLPRLYGMSGPEVESRAEIKVGNYYSVPCVDIEDGPLSLILPVLGPLHDDHEIPQFGNDAASPHWHVFWPFVPKELYRTLLTAWA